MFVGKEQRAGFVWNEQLFVSHSNFVLLHCDLES